MALLNYYCSCSLFHIRARGFSFDFLEQRQDHRQRTQANQTQQIETTSKNKGQRTNNKNKEQYQTPKKKHKFEEQNKK